MYTSGIPFRAYHHACSLTWKCVPVVRNFVPIITLPVQHGNVYQWYTFSCLSSRFQSNTEMYSSAVHFRAYHHTFSLTWKRVPVVCNFVPTITLPVQHDFLNPGLQFRASCVIWRSHVSRAISPKVVRDFRNPSFAQTCPNSNASKAMVNHRSHIMFHL